MKETKTLSWPKPLEESGEHSLYFKKLRLRSVVLGNIHQVQVPGEEEKVLKLASGSHRYVQELPKFRASFAATSFCDICGDGTGRTSHLAAKPESFVIGKLPGELVNPQNELVAAPPNLELAEVLHLPLRIHCVTSTRNYLQLNTYYCQLPPRSSHAA